MGAFYDEVNKPGMCFGDDSGVITLQPLNAGHEEFLFKLFVECRPDLDWINGVDGGTKAGIIRQQFICEQEQMKSLCPGADYLAVILDGELVGRIFVDFDTEAYRILAIGLLQGYRRKGLGMKLVTAVKDGAARVGKQVQLRVAWFNRPAQAFYERLGFRLVEDTGDGFEMRWIPPVID